MNILIATVQVPFVRGGAEILAEGLIEALRAEGHNAEIVAIPFKAFPHEVVTDHMLACGLLDLSVFSVKVDRVIALKFPAYLIPHPNKRMWLVHQHRQAYDLWETPYGMSISPMASFVRETILQADKKVFSESGPIYTIAGNVSKRLEKFCGISSEPLYCPPAGADQFFCGEDRDYFFYPSRLNVLKRQFLIVEALAKTKQSVRVRFAGIPDAPAYAEELKLLAHRLGVADRVEWLGMVSEEEKQNLYAHSRAVIFTPVDEDYGYVTLEAMLSSKAVLTCTDSGGPLEFIQHGVNGLIAQPNAEELALAMDELWLDRVLSKKMGQASRARYMDMNISWKNILETLLA